MGIARAEFLRLVEAFNKEQPEALTYFTQHFHYQEPEALALLFRWAAPIQPNFVLGYVRWALAGCIDGLVLPKAEQWNLTMFFSDEPIWLKRLCQALNECVFAASAEPPLARPLAQALVKRCLLTWAADPALALRSIQLVLPWTKVTLRMLRVACASGERNAIMPLFSCWANRIQLRHSLPLPQCPEYAKLDLRFSARITPQDWQLLAERLGLLPSNALLITSMEVGNTALATSLISEGFPIEFSSSEEAKLFCERALGAKVSDSLFRELMQSRAFSGSEPWLCEVLLHAERPELLLWMWNCFNEADIRSVEQRVLQHIATSTEAPLAAAERCGLLTELMNRSWPNGAFVQQINSAIRSNGKLSKYFY